ncbi:hypothetical protein [Longimicrobium sp.]|uniref:hypothetical protein n=1 Tax=Longimicrobium sp. TaxID=2029185 RepID=UPI002F95B7BD
MVETSKFAAWVEELNSAPATAHYQWASEFRRRNRSPELHAFLDAIEKWQTNPDLCKAMKADARVVLSGGPGSLEASILLKAVASAGGTAPELYRGVGASGTVWAVLQHYHAGTEFDIALASFSSDRGVASEFAWLACDSGHNVEVVFVLQAGSCSVRIDVLAPDHIHWREREWFSGGRFAVVDTRVVSDEMVEILIEQRKVFDVG